MSDNPSCGSQDEGAPENKALHVIAVFVIFIVSSAAATFPIIAVRYPRLRVPQKLLFLFKHFGTGVLIATAFCHLLPTAFISLLDPCLGSDSFWLDKYPAISGAIAMAGVFLVAIVELTFAELAGGKGCHHHRSEFVDGGPQSSASESDATFQSDIDPTTKPAGMGEKSPEELKTEQVEKQAFMQCLMLELGILFHSVFIGMALSVSRGTEFLVLFIAIIFHQTFEGLSLGARISLLRFRPVLPETGFRISNKLKPYLMSMAYGLTTPIGQAIGLILIYSPGSSYDPASRTALILVGVMNAISAGLLLWASLVELLAADFFGEERTTGIMAERKWRIIAFVAVFLGAASMATVGAWA